MMEPAANVPAGPPHGAEGGDTQPFDAPAITAAPVEGGDAPARGGKPGASPATTRQEGCQCSCHQEKPSPAAAGAPARRFGVGDRVLANYKKAWEPGTVTALDWRGRKWAADKPAAAYQPVHPAATRAPSYGRIPHCCPRRVVLFAVFSVRAGFGSTPSRTC